MSVIQARGSESDEQEEVVVMSKRKLSVEQAEVWSDEQEEVVVMSKRKLSVEQAEVWSDEQD